MDPVQLVQFHSIDSYQIVVGRALTQIQFSGMTLAVDAGTFCASSVEQD